MLAAERKKFILGVLKSEGRVLATELSARLGISEDTIRRDLRDLADEGLLQRVHGGALPRSPAAVSYADRQHQLSHGKIAIARRAAGLIRDGMVVFLGGGTTNTRLAASLSPDLRATILTHNPAAAIALAEHPNVDVILIGGHLLKTMLVTVGVDAVENIQRMRADLCMLGVCSLHPEAGISIPILEEAYVQRAMIASSAEVVALASAEKLGTAASFIVGPIRDVNIIVTEPSVPDEVLEPYRELGIEILR